jgi:hypothetical protein
MRVHATLCIAMRKEENHLQLSENNEASGGNDNESNFDEPPHPKS